MSALPTGTSCFLLAQIYQREVATSSGVVLVSTIFSFVTLSVLLTWFSALAPS
jgi:predicted permease